MVKIIDGGVAVDDRGQLSFVNDFNFENVKRFYMVENHEKGFIRAWHGHKKEGKYVYVPSGAILIGAVDLDTEQVDRFVLSSSKPQVLYIPPGYANGFMNLQDNTKVIFFSTSTLEESMGDDIRFEWDKWNIWNIERR
jgi:dTDP-4-dehydrorhamnose 3,5-epimerase|tara:strand:+ start:64 stop:477 length:414 start_codon:yes stop_codon:yes gene_type:complete